MKFRVCESDMRDKGLIYLFSGALCVGYGGGENGLISGVIFNAGLIAGGLR
jgi:hypothetical protein